MVMNVYVASGLRVWAERCGLRRDRHFYLDTGSGGCNGVAPGKYRGIWKNAK